MKIKKISFIVFSFIVFNYSYNSSIMYDKITQSSIKKAPYTKDSNNIANNGIYFIKNIGNSQIIDIPNSSYNSGVKPICYNANYFANQRFIITYEFEDTYRIKPMCSQNLVFGISNNELVLKEEEYNDTALFLDKFKFVRYGTSNYYFIKDYYDKYLTLSNKNTSNSSSLVVEDNIDNSNLDYYLWLFDETDSLNVNCVQQETINGNSYKYFNIRLPYSVSYKIETNQNDVTIILYDSSGNQLCQNVGGQKYVIYNFTRNTDYSVRIYNNSTSSKIVQIKLYPLKTIFMYGIYDYYTHKHDRITTLNNTKEYYEMAGIYPIVYSNIKANSLLYSLENNAINNWVPLNSDYIVIRSHGSSNGFQTYDGINISQITYSQINTMSNVDFVAWLQCNGAFNTTGSYVTNLSREAVIKGAKYSLGFRGTIYTKCADTYATGLAEAFSLNYSPLDAIKYAHDYTKSIHWIYYYNSQTLYSDNKIWDPYCYYKNSSNEIVYSIAHVYNPVSYSDDGGYLSNVSNNNSINDTIYSTLNQNNKYIEIDYFNNKIKLIKMNGIFTNIMYDENTYLNDYDVIFKNTKDYIDSNNCVILKVNNNYKVIRVIIDSNKDSYYYDCIEKKYISSEQFIKYSNNFVSMLDVI